MATPKGGIMATSLEVGEATAPVLPVIDLNEIKRLIVARVKVGERTYDVHSTLDVTMGELSSMLTEEAQVREKGGWMEQVALARKQVRLVVPDLSDDDLDGLTARQIVELSAQVIGILKPKEKE
jgi:hypothetical protein